MISVRFTLTREEHTKAIRHVGVRNRNVWLSAAIGVAFIAAGAALHVTSLSRGIWIGFGICYLVLVGCGVTLSPAIAARKAAQTRTESSYEFSEDRFSFQTSATKHTVGWQDVTKLVRAGAVSMLFSKNGLVYIVPDRAFASSVEVAHFITFATRQGDQPRK